MPNPAQRRIISAEKHEQAAVVHWLRVQRIPYVAHMTGVNLYGNWALVNHLKAVGCLQAGVPDLFIPVPSATYHGLWIEMKRERGGVLSCEQRQWMSDLNDRQYLAMRANGADEAIEIIKSYIKESR